MVEHFYFQPRGDYEIFAMLRNKVNFSNNLGGVLAVISRGPGRWGNVLVNEGTQEEYALFFQVADFFIFTTAIGGDQPLEVSRKRGMESNSKACRHQNVFDQSIQPGLVHSWLYHEMYWVIGVS